MMDLPLALQLRNPRSLVEIGVDKNSTVVFPAPTSDRHRASAGPLPKTCLNLGEPS
jgi:hypothetical protein